MFWECGRLFGGGDHFSVVDYPLWLEMDIE